MPYHHHHHHLPSCADGTEEKEKDIVVLRKEAAMDDPQTMAPPGEPLPGAAVVIGMRCCEGCMGCVVVRVVWDRKAWMIMVRVQRTAKTHYTYNSSHTTPHTYTTPQHNPPTYLVHSIICGHQHLPQDPCL